MTRPLLLVLRALGLGDFLTGVPAYRALAQAFAGHHRVLAAPPALAPLLPLTGAFDELLPAAALEAVSPGRNPDVAVNLHGRGPQSHRILLATHPARFIGFAHSEVPESLACPRWRPGEHEVHRWARLLQESGIPCSPASLGLRDPGAPPDRRLAGVTVVHPGAASAARRWPAERWSEVIRHQLALGRHVVITGTAAEYPLAEKLAGLCGLPDEDILSGRTDLLELASIVAGAGTVLSADTGIAHLAVALGTPSLTLFGPSSPDHWGPPDGSGRHRVLWKGSFGDPHGATPDEGLLSIGVDEVVSALSTMPLGGGGGI